MKSDIRFDQLKLDYLQGNSSKILKSEQDSTQPSQTLIFQGNLVENKTDRQLSPIIKSNRLRHNLKQCQSLVLDNEPDLEEFSIWGDIEELPVGNDKHNNIVSFLELYKYRYEKTTKKPVSCYNVILMTKKQNYTQSLDQQIDIQQLDQNTMGLTKYNGQILGIGVDQTILILYFALQQIININYMGNMCEYHARNINNEQNLQPKLLAQHRFQDIGIYLDTGDIKNEEVDVIVAQTDLNLKLPEYLINNVSPQTKQQLLKYIQQIRDKQVVSHGEVVHSHAAELEFDFVFYCILPNEDDEPMKLARNHNPKNINLKLPKNAPQKYQKQFIYDCMMTCLKVAEEMEITSICFPVMKSTKFTISTIATMQMIAVKNFLEENVTKIKFISQVRFCIQDDKDQELFKWAFDKVFMDTDDSSEASDEDSLNNNSGNSGSGSAGNSLSKNALFELQPTVKKPQQKNFEEDEFVKSFGANYYDKFESPQRVGRKISI